MSWLLVIVILLSVGSACAGPSGPQADAQARARWDANAPLHYRYIWHKRAMIGVSRIVVEVRDGRVVKSTPLKDDLKVMASGGPPTVEAVFAELRTAREDADEVIVSYDHDLGYPVSVRVDVSARSIDDEYEFGVQDVRAL